MDVSSVAFLVNESEDAWEGLRSALGLALEGLSCGLFFIGCPAGPPADKSEEDFAETLEMLEDMGGEIYTDLEANQEKWELINYLPLGDLAEKIKGHQLVAPF